MVEMEIRHSPLNIFFSGGGGRAGGPNWCPQIHTGKSRFSSITRLELRSVKRNNDNHWLKGNHMSISSVVTNSHKKMDSDFMSVLVHSLEVHPDESPNHREELPEVHLSTSGQESNTKHTKEKYGDSSALHGANQLYQDQRYRTVPQTGPLYHSDNPERSQHYLRMPQFGSPPYHDGTKERMDSPMTTSHSVSHHETVTPSHPTSQYSSERYAGSDTWGHAVFTQSITARPSDEVISDTNGNRSKSSSRTETRVSASGDARYANVQDISSYSGQKPFISNESDKRKSTKESARRHDDRDVKYGPAGTSSSEPMNVEQSENSRVSRNDATSLRNGMTGGTYGKTTVQSGITDLNAPLKHQLTIESNVRLAGKDSKQGSSTYSDHGKQPDSECITGAPEATGSRAGTTRGAQPPRLLYQLENNATTKEAASKSESIAADLKDHRAAKTEPKCLLPGLSWRTSAQKDQTPGTSSKNDPQNEISRESSFVKKGAGICELCLLSGTIICSNCRKTVCIKCMKIFATDLCETTKGQHVFVNMKDVKMPRKTSGNSKAYSSQESANASEACGDRETDWHCYRCTYLNPPGQRICVICATTRGISDVESAKPGSRVCRNCTLQNEETAVECIACHSLLTKNENYI